MEMMETTMDLTSLSSVKLARKVEDIANIVPYVESLDTSAMFVPRLRETVSHW